MLFIIFITMPVLLFVNTYSWLKKIGVFKADPIKTQKQEVFEVPYDEEIYLQNGYSIGVTLRKFVKPYSPQYQELLQIRKIATLKSSQNWQIIEPYLNQIGCDTISELSSDTDEIEISVNQIAEILQFLYELYSPKQQERLKWAKRNRNNYVDIYNFNSNKPLEEVDNSIQFVCILLVRNFKVTLGEALGLLMEKSKHLKKLVIQGSKIDQYESVLNLYEDFISSWPIAQQFFHPFPKDLEKVLQGISEGVRSEKKEVAYAALKLLALVENEAWFMDKGYYKLLSSGYIQCFFFTIEKLSPHYGKVLNQNLHTKITDKSLLLTILHNLVKSLPKSIYLKQILTTLPLQYFYEQCYSVLNRDDIDDQPPKLVIQAKELLTKLMTTFVDKIPNTYVKRIIETFKYNGNRNYAETYFNLSLLFQILEVMMLRESPLLERFFKVCMNYWGSTFGETRHWIIENLRYLYQKMGKSFPLGGMLVMYSMDSIAQADEYSLFYEVSQERNNLSEKESTLAIGCLIKYIQSQLHCKCFLTLLRLFISNHPKSSAFCAQQVSVELLTQMQQINIPMLNQGEINILNPKPPLKNRVINSIGMKRKQMLKFAQYELGKQLLQIFATLKDKDYLIFYANALSHTINEVEKQIGHRKKQLVNLLKQIRRKVKKSIEQAHESQPMSEIVKSIIINRSTISNGGSHQLPFTPQYTPLSESKLLADSQFSVLSEGEPSGNQKIGGHSIIKEQEEQDESENQFIPDQPNPHAAGKYENLYQSKSPTPQLVTDFTDSKIEDEEIFILSNPVLEQYQIAYMNVVKQKYHHLIKFCTHMYNQLSNKPPKLDQGLEKFFTQIGISRILPISIAIKILHKCRNLSATPHQLVQNFLIQSSFYVFAFKQNRRVAVTCITSLFTLINQHLRQKNLQFRNFEKNRKNQPQMLNKNVQFQYRLGKKITEGVRNLHPSEKNKNIQSFIVCFEVLSQILNEKLSLRLVQPYSKQINQFITVSLNSNAKEDIRTPKGQKQKTEVERLEQMIDQSEEIGQKNKYSLHKTKKLVKKQPNREVQSIKVPAPVASQNSQSLRNKLAKRLKILNEDLIKNGKNMGRLIENGKLEESDNIKVEVQ